MRSIQKTAIIVTLTNVFALPYLDIVDNQKVLAETQKAETQLPSQENERIFKLKGKGNVKEIKDIHRRGGFSYSPYEPTGLYAKANEKITIEVKGTQNIQAYIGTYAYDKDPDKFTLQPGKNEISSPTGGILYLENANQKEEISVHVSSGGEKIPFFKLGKHTKVDWEKMMNDFPNAYAVELLGERSLITVTYEQAKKYLEGKDPSELLRKLDEIIRIEDKVAGISESYSGVAAFDSHYNHLVEDRKWSGWMYATEYRTGYIPGAVQAILDVDLLKNGGWGPWHELGHTRQQGPWKWDGLGEVTVNIYSLSVQRALNHESRLENDDKYPKVFEYLEKPKVEKDFDKIDDVFIKLIMFWQLDLAFGENFYPTLHQAYRLLPENELPKTNDEKKQMFMYIASKVSNRNLIPFFEKWGLLASESTIQKIKELHVPDLKHEIWLGRDKKKIIENEISTYTVPGGVAVPQNVEIGSRAEDQDSSKFVTNLTSSAKTTGKMDVNTSKIGDSVAKVEIEDQNKGKNTITVPVNVVYGDSLVFQGIGNWNSATVTLNHKSKRLTAVTENENSVIHNFFPNQYYSLTVFNSDGVTERLRALANGTDTPQSFVKSIHNFPIVYGDIIKIQHEEPTGRFHHFENNTEVSPLFSKNKTKLYRVTEQGFEEIDQLNDNIPPEAPKINDVKDTDTKLSGTGEAGAKVSVKVDGKEIGAGAVDAQGKFSIGIPKQVSGTEVSVTLIDAAGNKSTEMKIKVQMDPVTQAQLIKDAKQEIASISTDLIQANYNHNFTVLKKGALQIDVTQIKIDNVQRKVHEISNQNSEKEKLQTEVIRVQKLLDIRLKESQENLAKNGTFDSGLEYWKPWIGLGSVSPSVEESKDKTRNVVKVNSNSSVEQILKGLKANTKYEFTVYAKSPTGEKMSIGVKNTGTANVSAPVYSKDYSQVKLRFTTGKNTTQATLYLYKSAESGAGIGYADEITVKQL
ncbi:M60 family metallopeptidase [Bacillus toyonensis]|uniref:M60 family metallopeptidase n=1 Tax=Bacillus toyonensis TaxID=155322 RepID=UPI003D23BFC7